MQGSEIFSKGIENFREIRRKEIRRNKLIVPDMDAFNTHLEVCIENSTSILNYLKQKSCLSLTWVLHVSFASWETFFNKQADIYLTFHSITLHGLSIPDRRVKEQRNVLEISHRK